mgnify:CR=1 FL=1
MILPSKLLTFTPTSPDMLMKRSRALPLFHTHPYTPGVLSDAAHPWTPVVST